MDKAPREACRGEERTPVRFRTGLIAPHPPAIISVLVSSFPRSFVYFLWPCLGKVHENNGAAWQVETGLFSNQHHSTGEALHFLICPAPARTSAECPLCLAGVESYGCRLLRVERLATASSAVHVVHDLTLRSRASQPTTNRHLQLLLGPAADLGAGLQRRMPGPVWHRPTEACLVMAHDYHGCPSFVPCHYLDYTMYTTHRILSQSSRAWTTASQPEHASVGFENVSRAKLARPTSR